jgi:hypothetical protein
MNNNDKITILTEDFMTEIKAKFRKAGYKTKTVKHSAIVIIGFEKGNDDIWFAGWKKGVYGISYSIIHDCGKTDKTTYKDEDPKIFIMPNEKPKYECGMIKGSIATDEELDTYNINLKKAKEWIEKNI